MNLGYLFLAGVAVLSTGASAQGVYRCGNEYSAQPCGANSKQVVAPPPPPAVSTSTLPPRPHVLPDTKPPPVERIAANLALCESATRLKMKDPDAAKIRPIRRHGPTTVFIDGKFVHGIDYFVAANGKNSYGGYTGEKLFICAFDRAEMTLLRTSETDSPAELVSLPR